MNFSDLTTFAFLILAGLAGLFFFIFVCYLLFNFLRFAQPIPEPRSRADYPMDGRLHKPQMEDTPARVESK